MGRVQRQPGQLGQRRIEHGKGGLRVAAIEVQACPQAIEIHHLRLRLRKLVENDQRFIVALCVG